MYSCTAGRRQVNLACPAQDVLKISSSSLSVSVLHNPEGTVLVFCEPCYVSCCLQNLPVLPGGRRHPAWFDTPIWAYKVKARPYASKVYAVGISGVW